MNKLILKLSIVFLSLCVFVSCVNSDEIESETVIYQQYSLNYNKNENKTKASAIFNLNNKLGKSIILGENVKLLCNGKKGYKGQIIPINIWNFEGKVDCNFSFTKENGEVFKNTIKASDIEDISIPSSFKSLKKDENYTFNWIGKPIQLGETITINIRQQGKGGEENIGSGEILSVMINDTKIDINKIRLKNLIKGKKATFILQRTKSKKAQQVDKLAGGKLKDSTIISKDIMIE